MNELLLHLVMDFCIVSLANIMWPCLLCRKTSHEWRFSRSMPARKRSRSGLSFWPCWIDQMASSWIWYATCEMMQHPDKFITENMGGPSKWRNCFYQRTVVAYTRTESQPSSFIITSYLMLRFLCNFHILKHHILTYHCCVHTIHNLVIFPCSAMRTLYLLVEILRCHDSKFSSLNYAFHVKLHVSHSRLAKFEHIRYSRKFAYEYFYVAVELCSSMERLSGEEMNWRPQKWLPRVTEAYLKGHAFVHYKYCKWLQGYKMSWPPRILMILHVCLWNLLLLFIMLGKESQAQFNADTLAVPLVARACRVKSLMWSRTVSKRATQHWPLISWHHTVHTKMVVAVGGRSLEEAIFWVTVCYISHVLLSL